VGASRKKAQKKRKKVRKKSWLSATFMLRVPPTPHAEVLAKVVPTSSWHGSCCGAI
jgi:hypothetical protein